MVPTAVGGNTGKINCADTLSSKINGSVNGETATSGNVFSVNTHTGTLADYAAPKELKIPVPYGHIAAKEWGPAAGQPVLGLHGWQDNAATFDGLVKHLPATIHLIVIDFPGHGLSSHLPHGAVYGCLQFLVDVRRVVNFLGWQQFSILAHSLGAIISFLYSAVHPEQVVKFVSIDILYPGTRLKDAATIRKFVDSFLLEEVKENSNDDTFAHTEESALDLMWKRRSGLTKEGAVYLLKRGCKKSEDGVVFTRDHRLKPFILQPWEVDSTDMIFQVMKNIKAELLVIIATDSKLPTCPAEVQKQTREILSQSCKSFRCVELKGSHFIHLNEPASVAVHVKKFLCAENGSTLNNNIH